MTQKQLGKFMADARKKRGLTQAEISKKLGYGSSQFLSNFERGLCVFPLPKLKKLCQIIGVPITEIFLILVQIETARIRDGLK